MNTDPIADCLTRIRNAQQARHETTLIPHSNMKTALVKVLYEEGFVGAYKVSENAEGHKEILVTLRYDSKKQPLMTQITRNSKPGRRVYVAVKDLRPIRNGLGVSVLSTPKGLMTDRQAREQKLGGELLCTVW